MSDSPTFYATLYEERLSGYVDTAAEELRVRLARQADAFGQLLRDVAQYACA